MSKDNINDYATQAKYSEMGFAIERDHERFMYKWIINHQQSLSDKAKEVLDNATKVLSDTFKQRRTLGEDYPQYHFMRWDAGWEQIRKINQKGRPSEHYNNFNQSYDVLKAKVNNYIYKYGFLLHKEIDIK